MRLRCSVIPLGVALACVVGSADLAAQAPAAPWVARMDTEASTVAATLRAEGHPGPAIHVLTQEYAPQPREKMDEIADTLLRIAIGFPGADIVAHRTRTSAANTLMSATTRDTRTVPGSGGRRRTPYAGAVDRLIKLAENSPDVGHQGSALRTLRDVMDSGAYLAFVRQVAMSQSPAVLPAIRMLNEDTGAEGTAILRDLYERGLITSPNIEEYLDRAVSQRGWSGTGARWRVAFPRNPNPSAADVAENLRLHASAGQVPWVLTQAYVRAPHSRLDSIADTLAHIAISFPGDDATAARTRREAEFALGLAGSGRIGVDSGTVVPYGGAASRLMRIVEHAHDPGIRARALTSMLLLPDTTQRLPTLRKVAISRNGVALTAIEILNLRSGPEGHAVLRELHRKGLVAEPRAREYLDRTASARGWMAPGIRAPMP